MMTLSKTAQRRYAYDARNAQPNKEPLSLAITQTALQLSAYQQAKTVLCMQQYDVYMHQIVTETKVFISCKKK